MNLKRVVVTGLGSLTPIGNDVATTWQAMLAGVSGASLITRFNASQFKCKIACEVKGFEPLNFFDRKECRKLDPFTQYGLVASDEAIKDSGLDTEHDKTRIGVIWGSGNGGVLTFQNEIRDYVKPLEARRMGKIMKSSLLSSLKALNKAGIEKPDAIITGTAMGCLENSEQLLMQLINEGETSLKPTYFMQSTHNTISSNIAIRLGCHGYNVTYTQDDESLEWAMRDAKQLLRSGKYKTVLVGCHDETTPLYRKLMERLGYKNLPSLHSIAIVLSCGK